MKFTHCLSLKLSILGLSLGGVLCGTLTRGQQAPRSGLVDDWITHHLIFSNSDTAVEALALGHLTATGLTGHLFVSPQTEPSRPTVAGCTGSEGYVISYANSGTTATLSGVGGYAGGASGMIIDGIAISTSVNTRGNIYFGQLSTSSCTGNNSVGTGTGACAIQAAQAKSAPKGWRRRPAFQGLRL